MDNKAEEQARLLARRLVLCNSDRAFVFAHRFYDTIHGPDKNKDTYVLTNLWTGYQGYETGL